MQPHKKGVKLFVDCLFYIRVSGNPCTLINTHEQFTPEEDVNLRKSYSRVQV